MRQLATWVVGAVVGTLLGSCAIGIAAVELGGRDAVTFGRDLAILVVAVMTWISAVVGFAIWFALAAGTGAATGPSVRGLRWVAARAHAADEATHRGIERFVMRPLAIGVNLATTASAAAARVASRTSQARREASSAVREGLAGVRSTVASVRPRGKVIVRTGVPVPPDDS